DWLGLALLLSGMSMLVFGIMEGPERGWTELSIALPLLGGTLVLVMLVVAERRIATPLIAVELFGNPSFSAYNLIIFSAQYAKMAIFVFGALYFQDSLGASPLMAGAALLPSVAPQILLAPWAGKLTDRYGPRLPSLAGILGLAMGLVIMGVGAAFNSLMLIMGGLLVLGVIMPLLFVPPQAAVLSTVPPAMQGQASGIIMSSQLVGGTVGMAICSTVYVVANSAAAVFWVTAGFAFCVFILSIIATAPRPGAAAA
ncbi:MAG: MFS transporter, partial [Pseudomonadota bacterium]